MKFRIIASIIVIIAIILAYIFVQAQNDQPEKNTTSDGIRLN